MKKIDKYQSIRHSDLQKISGGSIGQFVRGFLDGFTGHHHTH